MNILDNINLDYKQPFIVDMSDQEKWRNYFAYNVFIISLLDVSGPGAKQQN